MKIDWTDPRNLIIAGCGIVGVLLMLPKLGDAVDYARKLLGTTEVAYAAHQQVAEVRSEFDEYIAQQQQALGLEQERLKLQEQYNQRLLAIQQHQQQQPMGQATSAPLREWDGNRGVYWCCQQGDRDACFDQQLWYACR